MKIGIVLGGGAVKGAYQIGFLKALLQHVGKEEIKAISCSSIGVLNGYALASNKFDQVYDIWKNLNFETPIDVIANVWENKLLKNIIANMVTANDHLQFPVYTSVCFLPLISLKYYKFEGDYKRDWSKLVSGATFFPLFSGGLKFYHGQIAVDGGMIDNIPLKPLAEEEDLDLIFVLHFQPQYKVPQKYRNKKTVIIDLDVSSQNQFRKYFVNFNKYIIDDMLYSGYQYGNHICSTLFAGERTLDSVRNAAAKIYDAEREFRANHPTLNRVSKANKFFAPLRNLKNRVKILDN